jgi:valyl-tRNA synthetase
MPFITEELWQVVAEIYGNKKTNSIMVAKYPQVEEVNVSNQNIDEDIAFLRELCLVVRNLRAEMNLSPAVKVPLEIEVKDEHFYIIKSFSAYLQSLTKLSEVKIVDAITSTDSPVVILRGMRLMLEVEIDKNVEKIRIEKELDKLSKDLEKIKVKLDNPSYVERAPKDIVQKDTLRADELSGKIQHFTKQLEQLQ